MKFRELCRGMFGFIGFLPFMNAMAGVLSLAELSKLAMDNDPTVKAAKFAEVSSGERLNQAQARLFTQVSLSAERYDNQLQIAAIEDKYPSLNRTLQVRQPLFRPALARTVDQARSEIQEAAALRETAQRDLLVRLTIAVFEFLLAKEQQRLNASLESFAQIQLQAAERAYVAGSGMRTDIDEARARLDAARVKVLESRLQADTSMRQIERMTGRTDLVLAGLKLPWPEGPVMKLPSIDEHWQQAERYQPQLRVLSQRLESAKLDVNRLQAAHMPTLDMVARWTYSQSENVLNPASRYHNRQLGVQLNVPLYEGGGTQAAVREAVSKVDEAEQKLRAMRDDVDQRLFAQRRAIEEGELKVKAQQQAVFSAKQMAISTQRSLEAGLRTRLDVLNAQQLLLQAQRDLMQAQLGSLMAHVQMQVLVGEQPEQWLHALTPWFAVD